MYRGDCMKIKKVISTALTLTIVTSACYYAAPVAADEFDGNESKYSYDKPFSAFRMVLAPKSEKQRLISYWNRDIGTNNVD